MAFGLGVLRGMSITMSRVIKTYIGDFKHLGKPHDPKTLAERQSVRGSGIFTIQYPEEKLKPQENFRLIPMLLYEPLVDEKTGKPMIDEKTGKEVVASERCTSCGICSKVCPPQCIWILRATKDGKPQPKSAEFYIDIDVCMNCGMCAEFCPFDSIKMDHDYEMANYERHVSHIFDKAQLLKSTTYYASIHPTDWHQEEAERKAKEAAKAKK